MTAWLQNEGIPLKSLQLNLGEEEVCFKMIRCLIVYMYIKGRGFSSINSANVSSWILEWKRQTSWWRKVWTSICIVTTLGDDFQDHNSYILTLLRKIINCLFLVLVIVEWNPLKPRPRLKGSNCFNELKNRMILWKFSAFFYRLFFFNFLNRSIPASKWFWQQIRFRPTLNQLHFCIFNWFSWRKILISYFNVRKRV